MSTRSEQRAATRRIRAEQEDARLDITEDLTETQLAEIAFDTEVVVYRGTVPTMREYGIIVGYKDPEDPVPGSGGRFMIDRVEPGPNADDAEAWREIGKTIWLSRHQFVVFGPANRDPGDREVDPSPDGWEVLRDQPANHDQRAIKAAYEGLKQIEGYDDQMTPFVCAAIELIAVRDDDKFASPKFSVRLDAPADDSEERHYRLLVRPREQPLLQDEIEQVFAIANRYELWTQMATGVPGLEIRFPHDMGGA